jgi:hypothetical protein
LDAVAHSETRTASDALLSTAPIQLGVGDDAHVIESILNHVASALGWR